MEEAELDYTREECDAIARFIDQGHTGRVSLEQFDKVLPKAAKASDPQVRLSSLVHIC